MKASIKCKWKSAGSVLVLMAYLLASLFGLFPATVFGAPVPQPEKEIGRGKPAYASKVAENQDPPTVEANVNDGDYDTRWYDGALSAGNWIYIDLEQEYAIGTVTLRWGMEASTNPGGYQLQLLGEGEDPSGAGWRTVADRGAASPGQVENITVDDVARYVRVYITAPGQYGTSLFEMEIFEYDEQVKERPVFLCSRMYLAPGDVASLLLTQGNIEDMNFESSDASIVALEGNVATALAQGEAIITASPKGNPSNSSTCTLIVSENPTPAVYAIEGEAGSLVDGVNGVAMFVRESEPASGGYVADGFYDSGSGAGVAFTMPDGMDETEYRLDIQYSRNTFLAEVDYMGIWVNGEYAATYTCPSTGDYEVYAFGPIPAYITVKAGDTLKIGPDHVRGHLGLYRLDKIELTETTAIPPQSIALPNSIEMLEWETTTIEVSTTPAHANTTIVWASSNEAVATVEEGGFIKAFSEGTTVVTATSLLNPAVKNEVTVTVHKNDTLASIANGSVSVLLDKSFPRVLEYTMLPSQNTMSGNYNKLEQLVVNDTAYTPAVSVLEQKEDELTYAMYIAELDATIYMRASVEGTVFRLEVVEVEESSEAGRVFTIAIPQHSIVSVNTADEGAQFAGAIANMDVRKSGDTIVDLQKVSAADSSASEYLYGFLSNGKVAAGLYTNAMKSDTTIRTGQGGYEKQVKVYKQTVAEGNGFRTNLSSMAWMYRINDYTKTFEDLPNRYPEEHSGNSKVITHTYKNEPEAEKPFLSVALAEDINGSGTVDWQDAAILLRDEAPPALHQENIQNLVVHRILTQQNGVTNFPFATITDDTKKVYLRTDGLGQMVLDKFHNEENWGDFTRYDNRLGGLRDFRNMVDEVTLNYNSYVGVHSNFYEYQAKTSWFSPEFTRMRADGVTPYNMGFSAWGAYLGQMYIVDATADAMSGNRLERMQQFKEDVPNLGFIYNDVFAYTGWNGKAMANDYRNADIGYFLEYSECNLEEALWGHWAVEQGYNSAASSGIASDIIRFMWNHTKDRWAGGGHDSVHVADSYNLLMGTDATSFECWPNGDTQFQYDAAMEKVFDNNLPTKFMQHFPILRMEKDAAGWGTHIWFEDDVEVYLNSAGKRTIERHGKVIYNEDSYLIPWDEGIVGEQGLKDIVKLYHWNENGGSTSWELPDEWSGYSSVYVYRLTDQGKVDETEVPVIGGKITLDGIEKRTAYVVYPASTENVDVQYGAGGYVADPGFNYGDLRAWTVDKGNPSVERNNSTGDDPEFLVKPFQGQLRNYELMVLDTEEAQVSQVITGLAPGEYAASVLVEVEQGHRRRASILVDVDGLTYSHYTDQSAHMNMEIYDVKARTYMQRMRVIFQVPEGDSRVVLRLHAEAGDGVVRFDNPRIYDTITKVPDGADPERVVEYQDFEHALREGVTGNDRYMVTYEGSEPLVNGPGTLKSNGDLRELRSLILQRNEPYTQNGLTGSQWDPYTLNVDDVLDGERTFRTQTSLQGEQGTSTGTIYQTVPETLRLEEGRTYRVSFLYQYQHATADEYAFVVGAGAHTPGTHRNPDNIVEKVPLASTSPATTEADRIGEFSHEFTVDSDDYWIGLFRVKETYTASANPSPFQLDNLLVEDVTPGAPLRTIHIRDSENGSITLLAVSKNVQNMGRVESGTKVIVEARPDNGYELRKLLLNGTEIACDEAVLITEDATFEAFFAQPGSELADKTALMNLYTGHKDLTNDAGYTANSWAAFETALTEAKRVLDNENATQKDVDVAAEALQAAIDGLLVLDYTGLKAAIAQAEALQAGDYTSQSWAALQAALTKAQLVLLSANTQKEVDNAVTALQLAIDSLVETKPDTPVDLAPLQDLLQKAATYKQQNYTPESWKQLEAAVAKANVVLQQDAPNQAAVNEAITLLQQAINGLVKQQPADKTTLRGLVEKYEKLTQGSYTNASWKAFKDSLLAAQSVLAADNATQDQIDAALTALESAYKNLATASKGSSDPTVASTGDNHALPKMLMLVILFTCASACWLLFKKRQTN